MNRIVVAAAALNQTPLAWEDNLRNIRTAISLARKSGAQVLCLPELCITGYGCEDQFHSEEFAAEALNYALKIARESKGLVVNFGMPLIVNGITYNVVGVAINGVLRGFVAKQHLAGDGVHYEPRWFKPWPRGVVQQISINGIDVPVGDLFFDVNGVRVAFEICEDAWVADRSGMALARHGVDLILNPSASHFAFGKHDIRKRVVLEGSRAYGVGYIYANLLGCEAGRIIYDGDSFIASHGELVAEGSPFSYQDLVVTIGVVDLGRCRLARRRSVSVVQEIESGGSCVAVSDWSMKEANVTKSDRTDGLKGRLQTSAWSDFSNLKHEEFSRAVALGLFDYLRKSKSNGFVVSLSGGVDSSAVSCLVALMIKSAVAELGLSGFKERFSFISGISKVRAENEIYPLLLACVYQRTRNSSDITREAARQLAKDIGATFYELDIDPIVESYTRLISKSMGVKISWKDNDLALQNIQARSRSPSVWMIANLRRALLLATSNRSEASVGYTTMDGDSSGGLAPLGGIDKAYLRDWLVWLENTGPAGMRSFSSLSYVNAQEPTAELRPGSAHQTDEGDLMPYVILSAIERLAVRDKLMPLSVYRELCRVYEDSFSKGDLARWIERFFTLWCANQWKRERYAPSFHLDDESVDPKTWCRFPILSAGFERELAALRKSVRV